jgi:hypothetical protein
MDEFEKIDRDINAEKEKTQLKKEKFIKDIKNGLGEQIKFNGNKVRVIKKSKFRRFLERLMDIF